MNINFLAFKKRNTDDIIRKHKEAAALLMRFATAYKNGNAFGFNQLLHLVGKGWQEMEQDKEGESEPLLMNATKKDDEVHVECKYPPLAVLGEHYHPDCDEVLTVSQGSMVVHVQGKQSELLEPGRDLFVKRGLLHSVETLKDGCIFTVRFVP